MKARAVAPVESEPAGPTCERRYLLDRRQADGLLGVVASRLHRVVYDPARPIAYARTTYLDTDDLRSFHAQPGPAPVRCRVRQYASAADVHAPPRLTRACYLELDEGTARLRSRQRLALDPSCEAAVAIDPCPSPRLLRVLGGIGRRGGLFPKVTTWVRRTTFRSFLGDLRIALDEAIVYAPPTWLGPPGEIAIPRGLIALGPSRLVSIKHRDAWLPPWLARLLADLPEALEFSRYRSAMSALLDRFDPSSTRVTRPMPPLAEAAS